MSVSPSASRPPSTKQSTCEDDSKSCIHVHGAKYVCQDNIEYEGLPTMSKDYFSSQEINTDLELEGSNDKSAKALPQEKVLTGIKHPIHDPGSFNSSVSFNFQSIISAQNEGEEFQFNHHGACHSALNFPSPSSSVYTASLYVEAKESFTNTEVSEEASVIGKYGESMEVSNPPDNEGSKTSIYRGSTGSDVSDESSSSTLSSTMSKPHKGNDRRWDAIKAVRSRDGALQFRHFRLLMRLGCGDIGSVYLSELIGTQTYFAMKIMDKAALAARKKLLRAQTEREILQSLDHPFLPTLYTHFDTERSTCLVMEFCSGGDLHSVRQRQPGKCFSEHAARFYVAEVLLALEYLHMLGIIYRDLKPENVLVRDDGHIMLSDFDLSLRCVFSPTLVKLSNLDSKKSSFCVQPAACIEPTCVMQPDCMQPTCFRPKFLTGKPKKEKKKQNKNQTNHQVKLLPELIAEPTSARSMSFVGTHEYLAPEIIKGEGHGSAVDWWTFGIFLFELLFGKTPFKGDCNRATLFNVVGQPLTFPESPTASFAARDLIRGLLVKEPQHRLAYRRGATEIKQHPFFQNVNWALIRCMHPPEVPKHLRAQMQKITTTTTADPAAAVTDVKPCGNFYEIDFF